MVSGSLRFNLAQLFMKAAISRFLSTAGVLAGMLLANAPLVRSAVGQEAVQATAAFSLLPGGILPDSPLAQVVKLVQAGVDVGIIETFVTNSPSTFNLDADKIIALKDVGAPNELPALMMQHDRVLQAQMAVANPPPAAEPAAAVATPTPPPVDDATAGIAPAAPDVTVNYFYDLLAPYGNWVALDGYGRCWQPGVAVYHPDWEPYGDHGHWVYTDSGWYWVSDYSWGWVPFHYGRWLHDSKLGWCWCPDTVWGPSWVIWRYSDDYCGWAPLPPGSEYVDGSGFVYDGSVVAPDYDFGIAPDFFIFVGIQDFCDPHPFRHRIDGSRRLAVYHQTTVVNRFDRDDRRGFINHGIDPARITRVTHVAIQPLAIHETAGVVGLFGHGEAVRGTAVVINRPQFRDNQGNLAVAWNQNSAPAVRPVAPPGAPAVAPEPASAPLGYQWANQPPAPADSPLQNLRPTDGVDHPAPADPRLGNNDRPYVRPDLPRLEAPREQFSLPEERREPAPVEHPAPREELKPEAEPVHNTPVPEPVDNKSGKGADSKNGPH